MLKLNPQEHPNSTPPLDATTFRWLSTGEEGLDAMLEAIAGATVSLQLETYIFAPGLLGLRFREALIQARRRGVRVQVLLDAFGSLGLPTNFWNPLLQLGGEFRWFNSFRAAERYGHRNHRKLLVADSLLAIVGGFNVGEDYYGDGVARGWRDLGLQIKGPLVAALEESFFHLFEKAADPPPAFPPFHPTTDTAIRGCSWTLLLSEPGLGRRAFKRALLHDLSRARDVRIICAYFVPTWRLRRALIRTAQRGGRVQLILAGRSDIEVSRLASRSLYAKLLRAGVEICEYQPQILHAKLLIIDHVVYAGSANLDARSLNINHELMIRIDNEKTAGQARAIFEDDLTRSRPIDPQTWRASRSFFTRLLEKIAYFLLVRIDPLLISLRWRNRAQHALEKQRKR